MLKVQETKMDTFLYLDLGGECMGAYLCKNSELLTKDLCILLCISIRNPNQTTTRHKFPVCYPLLKGPTSSWDPSQTRNQTGPPNIVGGLGGEGNDL